MSWLPLISNAELQRRIVEVATHITNDIRNRYVRDRERLPYGSNVPMVANHAILFAYAGRVLNRPDLLQQADRCLDLVERELSQCTLTTQLYGGIAGVGWAFDTASEMLDIAAASLSDNDDVTSDDVTSDDVTSDDVTSDDVTSDDVTSDDVTSDDDETNGNDDAGDNDDNDDDDDDDAGNDIDALLLEHLQASPWPESYDLISGLVGYGVYFVSRMPADIGRRGLDAVITRLLELAETTKHGATWHTPPRLLPSWQREFNPDGYYNLGLAHGVPGVIAVLGYAAAHNIQSDRVQPLLDQSIAWLLSTRHRDADGRPFFPAWLGAQANEHRSRLAWCYGDAGLAAALLLAGTITDRSEVCDAAVDILLSAADRTITDAGVHDAGLCHGAAGLLHVFARAHRATGNGKLGDLARYWLQQTLDLYKPDVGIGGYQSYVPPMARSARSPSTASDDAQQHWADDLSLLTGAAGIALALLAAVSDIPPDWDHILLTRIPPDHPA